MMTHEAGEGMATSTGGDYPFRCHICHWPTMQAHLIDGHMAACHRGYVPFATGEAPVKPDGRSVDESEALRIALDKEQRVQAGFYGPRGFVAFPGFGACGMAFGQWLSEREREARSVGEVRGEGCSRTFTREEVLLLIDAQVARGYENVTAALDGLRRIFERMA